MQALRVTCKINFIVMKTWFFVVTAVAQNLTRPRQVSTASLDQFSHLQPHGLTAPSLRIAEGMAKSLNEILGVA
jgi:hypothetical protein